MDELVDEEEGLWCHLLLQLTWYEHSGRRATKLRSTLLELLYQHLVVSANVNFFWLEAGQDEVKQQQEDRCLAASRSDRAVYGVELFEHYEDLRNVHVLEVL